MCSCGQSRRVVKEGKVQSTMTDFGANIRRAIGFSSHDMTREETDPFIYLAEFSTEAPAGFPDHPHCGYEMLNYVLSGSLRTEDFRGHEKTINGGEIQLVTVGKGIVHCEMPHGPESAHGLQLWVNLAAKDKMVPPAYKELLDKDIPKSKKDGVWIKNLAGDAEGLKSPILTKTPTLILEVKMDPRTKYTQTLPKSWTTLVYTLNGIIQLGPDKHKTTAEPHTILLLGDHGAHLDLENRGKKRAHFIIMAGEPIKEPIFQHGPMVLSTEEDMKETVEDFLKDRNAFEGGREWESFIVREDDLPPP